MKHRNTSLFTVLALVVVVLGSAGASVAQEAQDQEMGVTLVGLLSMSDEGGYVLVEGESGEEVRLEGEGLADHVDSNVEVTGEWAHDADDNMYFAVSSIRGVE